MLLLLLKITVGWGVFALLFSVALRHETFFKINRIYLIFSVLAGLGLPILLSFLEKENVVATGILVLPQITVGMQKLQNLESSEQFSSFQEVIFGLYFLGFAVAAARFFWGLRQIFLLAKNSKSEWDGGFRILKTGKFHLPFSFFNLIFLGKITPADSSDDWESSDELQKMLEHEKAHVRGGHSIDVVFLEILCTVFWFHPLVFWYKNALRNVHEYLADAATLQISDKKQYGLLLIRQTQSGLAPAFANHFFPSQLKKRIVMLTKNASPARSGWKFSLVLPLLAGLVFLFQNSNLAAQTAGVESSKIIQDSENDNREPETDAEFPGGTDALLKFLGENIKYPTDARKAKAEGVVLVKFVVGKTGEIFDIDEKEFKNGTRHQSLVDEAVRVIRSMPRWKPAVLDGKPVSTELCIPIKFKLD